MPLGRRPLCALIVLPVLALLAGLVTMGAHAQDRPVPSVAGGSCAQRALKFGVTDDPAEVERQTVFERRNTAVTEPGFYARAVVPTPTLHAASHGYVVVFYRPGLPAAQLRPLRALAAAARATKAPVIVAPRRQAAAVTALGLGQQLDCTAADAAQTTRVRAFAATIYPSLKA
ncbi:MAG TPA: DUF3105 domain-containing protein [Baekduia sp.]|nr:DUF3105 domain-containing protein [Baekduia sp.]